MIVVVVAAVDNIVVDNLVVVLQSVDKLVEKSVVVDKSVVVVVVDYRRVDVVVHMHCCSVVERTNSFVVVEPAVDTPSTVGHLSDTMAIVVVDQHVAIAKHL